MISADYFKNMKPYKDFSYWFRYSSSASELVAYVKDTKKSILIDYDGSKYSAILKLDSSKCPGILNDWDTFRALRPEMLLYIPAPNFTNSEDVIDYYEKLLFASTMVIAEDSGKDPDTVIGSVFKCLDWLRTTDFYTCPASTNYHDNFVGGLVLHTVKVAIKCMELCKIPTFGTKVDFAKAIRACLVHDWCKIGLYESFNRNVKDEATDSWDTVASYKYKKNRSVCLGHGASSMFIASKFFKLSYEEALAIRWHMGEYNVADSEMPEFSQACRQYPMVYLLQFADRLSCVDY